MANTPFQSRNPEIGEIIEIPLGTVMSRLARARRKLQEQLIDNDDTPQYSSDTPQYSSPRKEVHREL